MGYAPTVSAVVSDHSLEDSDDDQLYYTKIFLDETKRVSWRTVSVIHSLSISTIILTGTVCYETRPSLTHISES